jgi:coenzyme F420-reducing hydrogenase beta subunit
MLNLKEKVIQNGYCIGCGACTVAKDSPYEIMMDDDGRYQAAVKANNLSVDDTEASESCPFYNAEQNENTLASQRYSTTNSYDPIIGFHHRIYCGQVLEDDFYNRGSSGGAAKWLLFSLLKQGLVDYVIQVHNNDDKPGKLFEYSVDSREEDIINGSKSVYYPVEMSGVLDYIKNNPGRYVITGVPCFIKGIRLLQLKEPVLKERIKYCVGIFCGHLKSTFYAEMIGWQMGVKPEDLAYIDFRFKVKGKMANQKAVLAKSVKGLTVGPEVVHTIFGTDYGHGFFSYPACDFCDDVIAETADISFGDAWLPEFLQKGTSLVVSRNPELSAIIEQGMADKKLSMVPATAKQVYESQEAGFRHRRDGLAVRIHDLKKANEWVPVKRFNEIVSDGLRQRIFRKRRRLAQKSYPAFKNAKAKGRFSHFKTVMLKEIRQYKWLYLLWYGRRKLYRLLKLNDPKFNNRSLK